jgi:hypothetical protein
MCLGFQGEGAALWIDLGSGQGAFDIARPGVVAFYQIGVLRVHDAYEIGQLGSRFRMQAAAEFIGGLLQLDREVRQDGRYRIVEKQRFYACRGFKQLFADLCSVSSGCFIRHSRQ